MGMLERIKSVSLFKANAAEAPRLLAEDRTPYIITQNGAAKAVVQDVASYERTQETLAMLKLVVAARADAKAGRTIPLDDMIAELRARERSE